MARIHVPERFTLSSVLSTRKSYHLFFLVRLLQLVRRLRSTKDVVLLSTRTICSHGNKHSDADSRLSGVVQSYNATWRRRARFVDERPLISLTTTMNRDARWLLRISMLRPLVANVRPFAADSPVNERNFLWRFVRAPVYRITDSADYQKRKVFKNNYDTFCPPAQSRGAAVLKINKG